MFERTLLALGALCLGASLALAQEPAPGRVFVLVVGVEDYADPKITDLRYAEDDAQAVYEFFAKDERSPTTPERVKLLRGKAATQRGIRRAIRDHLIRQATGPEDTAIFYFAGHGFADAYGVYLGSVDTKLVELELSALAWSDLQRDWSRISAGRRVFIADACHSGGLEGLRGPGGIGKRVLALQPKGGSVSVTVAATAANQLSSEDKKSGHGVFTASLLEGLRGRADADRDGAVSLGELAQHVTRDVPRRAKAAGGNQTPEVHYAGDAALGRAIRLSGGAKPAAAGSEAEQRALRAELENAELREKLAQLEGRLAEAEAAGKQAESARVRLAKLKGQRLGPKAEAVHLRLAPYRVGEVHRERGSIQSKVQTKDSKGRSEDRGMNRSHTRTFRILEVEAGEASKLETRYASIEVTINGEREERYGKKLLGRTFHSHLNRRRRLRHADPKGERVDSVADEELDHAAGQVLKVWTPIARALGRTKLKPGDSVQLTGAAIKPLLEIPNDNEDLAAQVYQFRYLGTRAEPTGKVALFAVELRLAPSEPDKKQFEVTLRGELSVYVAGARLAGFELEGPVVLRLGEDRESVAGSGTLRLERRVEIGR